MKPPGSPETENTYPSPRKQTDPLHSAIHQESATQYFSVFLKSVWFENAHPFPRVSKHRAIIRGFSPERMAFLLSAPSFRTRSENTKKLRDRSASVLYSIPAYWYCSTCGQHSSADNPARQ